MDTWLRFFGPHFPSNEALLKFIEPLEALVLEDSRHPAKIMMHQTQRLISIADDLPAIRSGKESLQLVFLLICAENLAKMHDHFTGEGQSRAYVRKFFEVLVSGDDRDVLEHSFTHGMRPIPLRGIVDMLYDVRCDVVHEGKYWGFHFHDGRTPMLNTEPDVNVFIQLSSFRDIVVRGCIAAISQHAP